MGFRRKLQYFLVQNLNISNKQSIDLISSGRISINDEVIKTNIEIKPDDLICVESHILQHPAIFRSVAFYKPRGIETTLNAEIKDSLIEILPFKERLFPVGRLDKESEGLLILTNDGRNYDRTLRNEHGVEKEYQVTVDKIITDDFLQKMSAGIMIMGKITLPCKVERISEYEFGITLIQGLNRQIRRMCYKLDYEVTKLLRVRIGEIKIETLKPLEWRNIN